MLSSADHSESPPLLSIPRIYNAAHDLLERNLQASRGDKIAFIDDAGSYTYSDLAKRANRFANALGALGVQMEQRVLLSLHDSIDFPVAFLGCIKAGVVPIAMNTLNTVSDMSYILGDSRACALVISASLLKAFEPAIREARFLKHVVVSDIGEHSHHSMRNLLEKSADKYEPAPTTCDDFCFWLYSSGSTGAPKGTVHVHSSLIQTSELYAKPIAKYQADDTVFSVSKLSFAYGLGNSLTFPLAVGATAILMSERPTPAAICARLRQHRPTVFCAVPTVFAGLLAHADLPRREELRLRICVSAGEALPEEIGKRWYMRFGAHVLDGIGSTEMLHIYLSNRADDIRYGTTGRPVPGYQIRIVDENGQPVPVGEIGEFHVRGPTKASHYWNNRSRSCSTFVGEWMCTGDKYRQREDGYYIYEGRSDDLFKVSGLYVSPIEVESALIQHDAILEAAVVAKQDVDGLIKPCAYVVLKPERTVSEKELQQHVKERLAPYKYPRWIKFVKELPKTATGKIQRFKLREAQGLEGLAASSWHPWNYFSFHYGF